MLSNCPYINAKNEVINISQDSISFFATSGDTKYEMKFDLFEDIDKDSSRYEVSEKHVKFTLKKTSDEKWNYVTKDRNIYKNNILFQILITGKYIFFI